MTTLRIVRLSPLAKLPSYATPGDAGLDLCADIKVPAIFTHGWIAVVPTGLAVEIPHGYVGLVCPRSGLASKHGLTVLNAPGIVDSGYRGEVKVILVNHGAYQFTIDPGMRIAQLLIVPCAQVQIEERDHLYELSSSARQSGGFGSTGA